MQESGLGRGQGREDGGIRVAYVFADPVHFYSSQSKRHIDGRYEDNCNANWNLTSKPTTRTVIYSRIPKWFSSEAFLESWRSQFNLAED